MVVSLHSVTCQKCEVKYNTLVIDSEASSNLFLTILCSSTSAKKHNAETNGTFPQIERCLTFSDSLSLPDQSHNLISKLRQNGAQVNFGISRSIFVKGRATILFEEHVNLYALKGKTFVLCSFSGENEEAVMWHHRLDDNNFRNVKRLAHHVLGMSLKHSAFDQFCCCEVCKISKSRRQPVSRKMEK